MTLHICICKTVPMDMTFFAWYCVVTIFFVPYRASELAAVENLKKTMELLRMNLAASAGPAKNLAQVWRIYIAFCCRLLFIAKYECYKSMN